jgi:hypothetical protein
MLSLNAILKGLFEEQMDRVVVQKDAKGGLLSWTTPYETSGEGGWTWTTNVGDACDEEDY